jgi:hypothetical protein
MSKQSGDRMMEHLVIEHAYKAERGWPEVITMDQELKTSSGTHFCVVKGKDGCLLTDWHSKQSQKDALELPKSACTLIAHVAESFGARRPYQIPCYTDACINDVCYRGHPCYCSTTAWHDWAYISWRYSDERGGEFDASSICRIECFVDFTWAQGHVFLEEEDIDVIPGHYVVVTCIDDHSVSHACNSKLMLVGCMLKKKKFFLAPIEAIISPAFVIEGILDKKDECIIVENHQVWGRSFNEF